jgi:hypothetical protein
MLFGFNGSIMDVYAVVAWRDVIERRPGANKDRFWRREWVKGPFSSTDSYTEVRFTGRTGCEGEIDFMRESSALVTGWGCLLFVMRDADLK